MVLIKSFSTKVLYDHFKLLYKYLDKGDHIGECLELIMQTHSHTAFLTISF